MAFACLCDGAETADQIYCCEALVEWAAGHYDASWQAAERALLADPSHAPSWLLFAYARYKSGYRAEAIEVLEGLASDPDVGKRARLALRMNAHRHDRDQVHLSLGFEGGMGVSPLLVVDVPLTPHWGVRADARYATWFNGDLQGPGGGLGLTWNAVAGVWRFQLASSVGGFSNRQPSRMRVGAAIGGRTDVRLIPGLGLGTELGAGVQDGSDGPSAYPYFRAFLTVYAPGRKNW